MQSYFISHSHHLELRFLLHFARQCDRGARVGQYLGVVLAQEDHVGVQHPVQLDFQRRSGRLRQRRQRRRWRRCEGGQAQRWVTWRPSDNFCQCKMYICIWNAAILFLHHTRVVRSQEKWPLTPFKSYSCPPSFNIFYPFQLSPSTRSSPIFQFLALQGPLLCLYLQACRACRAFRACRASRPLSSHLSSSLVFLCSRWNEASDHTYEVRSILI